MYIPNSFELIIGDQIRFTSEMSWIFGRFLLILPHSKKYIFKFIENPVTLCMQRNQTFHPKRAYHLSVQKWLTKKLNDLNYKSLVGLVVFANPLQIQLLIFSAWPFGHGNIAIAWTWNDSLESLGFRSEGYSNLEFERRRSFHILYTIRFWKWINEFLFRYKSRSFDLRYPQWK